MSVLIGRIVRSWTLLIATATLAGGGTHEAKGAEGDPITKIEQNQPGFYVRVSCDHASRVYYEGDSLSIKLKCEVDAFIYAIYQQADGQKYQIFPNSGQPNNRVKGGDEVVIPARDDAFRWTVTAPFGQERILVLASKEPLKLVFGPDAPQGKFAPLSNEALKGAALELDQQPAKTWAEHLIEITTAERPANVAPTTGEHRVGLFIGIGEYQWSQLQVIDNLSFAVSDATQIGRTFQEVGGIGPNPELLVDRLATKKNIKAAITEMLPAMTRPGDTVFIYYSGHGGSIFDEPPGKPGHDEVDGKDEIICPYDLMDLDVVLLLDSNNKNGELEKANPERAQWVRQFLADPQIRAWLEEYFKLREEMKKLKDLPDSDPMKKETFKKLLVARQLIDSEIARATGISDDEFGHWLQKLDGRQVVIIMDSCLSGGISVHGKQAPAKDVNSPPKAFLRSTVGRLKDVGQRDVALFSATEYDRNALESQETWGGVMTHFLNDSMRRATGPLTLQQAFNEVKAEMDAFFAKKPGGDKKKHVPQLFNDCTKMPLLRQ